MPCRIIYETATGRVISIGTVWVDPLPAGYSFREYANLPDLAAQMWDEATADLIARPAKVLIDRLDDLITDPRFADFQTVWNGLSANRRNTLLSAIILFLGRRRYRTPSQDAIIG